MSTRARSFVAVAVTALLPSCVYMHEPFTTAKTSVADARLIGWWDEITSEGEGGNSAHVYRIRRKEGAANLLEMRQPHLKPQPGNLPEARPILIYVRPGKPELLSIGPEMGAQEAEGAAEERRYLPYKYDVPDERTFRLFPLDRDLFREAIRKGELQGKILDEFSPQPAAAEPAKTETRPADAAFSTNATSTDSQKAEPVRDNECIRLTSPAADVVRFIEKHGDKAFGTTPIVFKRISEDDVRRRGLD